MQRPHYSLADLRSCDASSTYTLNNPAIGWVVWLLSGHINYSNTLLDMNLIPNGIAIDIGNLTNPSICIDS